MLNSKSPVLTEITPLDSGLSSAIVLDLAAVGAGMLPVVGGKATNLGELIRAGLPVPRGFCITTEAYRRVAASARIDFGALAAALPKDVPLAAGQARQALIDAPIPSEIAETIVSAYRQLGTDVPVAVRSSATAEDLPSASFAGQQDTYLHVVGGDSLLEAVRRCWASLWTERAVVYRTTNGIDHRSVRLAVVIQRMIDAEVAGVLFTANPVTGRRRQAVIDASPGLGEAVVSGTVNPDHFVVNTNTSEIIERRLGDKRVEVRARPGGGTEHIYRAASADQSCLTDDEVRALAALGHRVEEHYGAPQDTEWAIDADGKLWLTQARPITTLFPLPEGDTGQGSRVYFCFSVGQGLNRPITPAGLAAFRLIASALARVIGIRVDDPHHGPPVFVEAGQRFFVDVTGVLRGRIGRTLLPRVLDVMEARTARVLRELSSDPRFSLTHRSPWLFLRRVLRLAVAYGVPLRIIQALARPAAAHAHVERIGKELAHRLELGTDPPATERLEFVERALSNDLIQLAPQTMPAAVAGLAMIAASAKLLGLPIEHEDLQTVLRGLPHNVTTEMDLALWELAVRLRADELSVRALEDEAPVDLARKFHLGELPPMTQAGLSAFLSKYGHRAVAEIDVGLPRWSDDPAYILGVLANYLRLNNSELAPASLFAKGAAAAEKMIDTLVARARLRGRLRAKLVSFCLRRVRELAGLREIPKNYMIIGLAAVRRQLSAIGGELVKLGPIENPCDVFFLDFREIRAALDNQDMRSVVAARRQRYDLELRRRHVPRVLLSDGTEPETYLAETSAAEGLAGTPASAGVVTGIARVILEPVGAHLEPGEILVAPSTDPGWTPLFLTAGGLVMEMGGANSHGAVVAREYGIPAIVGVPDATRRIVTGQRIALDGAAGTIVVLTK